MGKAAKRETGATGRRWRVSVALVVLGAVVLVYGIATQWVQRSRAD